MKKITTSRDNSNRLTVEVSNVHRFQYGYLAKKVAKKIGLEKSDDLTKGVEEVFCTYSLDGSSVSIEWDVWSGFSIVAIDPESEGLLNVIHAYLKKRYE